MTSGERLHGEPSESVAEERVAEARAVSGALGCGKSLFLGFPDGYVGSHGDSLLKELRKVAAAVRPDLILAPSPVDFHADHRALADVAAQLHQASGEARLAFYEVYTTLRLNCVIDIAAQVQRKMDAIMGYRKSLYGKPEVYVHAALGLNAQRSIFTQRAGYFEAFYVVGADVPADEVADYLSYRI